MSDPTYVWLIVCQRGGPFLKEGHVHVIRHPDDRDGELVARASSDRIRALSRRMRWENHIAVVRAPCVSAALSKTPLLAPTGATMTASDVDSREDLSPVSDERLGTSRLREWRRERAR